MDTLVGASKRTTTVTRHRRAPPRPQGAAAAADPTRRRRLGDLAVVTAGRRNTDALAGGMGDHDPSVHEQPHLDDSEQGDCDNRQKKRRLDRGLTAIARLPHPTRRATEPMTASNRSPTAEVLAAHPMTSNASSSAEDHERTGGGLAAIAQTAGTGRKRNGMTAPLETESAGKSRTRKLQPLKRAEEQRDEGEEDKGRQNAHD